MSIWGTCVRTKQKKNFRCFCFVTFWFTREILVNKLTLSNAWAAWMNRLKHRRRKWLYTYSVLVFYLRNVLVVGTDNRKCRNFKTWISMLSNWKQVSLFKCSWIYIFPSCSHSVPNLETTQLCIYLQLEIFIYIFPRSVYRDRRTFDGIELQSRYLDTNGGIKML